MPHTPEQVQSAFHQLFPTLAAQWNLTDEQLDNVLHAVSQPATLCIMPTGSGKSIIYWLSGLLLGGTTIVVSPLIALIDEQAEKLREHGHEALVFHSGIRQSTQVDNLRRFAAEEITPSFLFVSPERLATDGVFEVAIRRRRESVRLFVIDEIHCVSQWGLDFRPFYRQIPRFLNEIWGGTWPRVLGLTATLNLKDVSQVCDDFRIGTDHVRRSQLLIRNTINLQVIRLSNEEAKEQKLWDLLAIHKGQKTLVYVYRKYYKHGAEDLAAKATEMGFAASHFHADMSSKERQEVISAFKSEDYPVVLATNAFGMGIDIPDIRVVIHYMVPESVEQYYQEIGRAARDGNQADAYLLLTDKNVGVRRTHFINASFPSIEKIEEAFNSITGGTRATRTLKYFEEESSQSAFSYLVDFDGMSLIGKGLASMQSLEIVDAPELQTLFDATRSKGVIASAQKTGTPLDLVCRLLSEAILERRVEVTKALDKCLFVRGNFETLPDAIKTAILRDIETKRTYKHELLDYLVYLLDTCESSHQLHRQIGLYLGVDKHSVDRIYSTSRGELVRSKSEVIIANLLHKAGLEYEYERKLYYGHGTWIEPDFTIQVDGGARYWEHLGMLGIENYDRSWIRKKQVYDEYFPGSLVTTHESAVLSTSAQRVIDSLMGK